MAFTTPITWVAGDVLTAAQLNQQVRDNVTFLHNRGRLLHVREQQPAGTDGGTFTSGAWQTRVLNTVVTNDIPGASLGSNQITLPAGTYDIDASAPAGEVSAHKAKLANITDTADTIIGTTNHAGGASVIRTHAFVRGRFTIASSKVFELRHRCQTTIATTGFGGGRDFGVVEVYSEVLIRAVSLG